jgi:hypothetical protein
MRIGFARLLRSVSTPTVQITDKGCYDHDVQGLNIAPTLIAVAPTRTVVSSSGPLDVSPVGVTETLPPLPSLPGKDA